MWGTLWHLLKHFLFAEMVLFTYSVFEEVGGKILICVTFTNFCALLWKVNNCLFVCFWKGRGQSQYTCEIYRRDLDGQIPWNMAELLRAYSHRVGFWMAQCEDEFPVWVWVSGHLQALIQSIGQLQLKVQRCPMLSHQPICINYQDENNNILGVGHLRTLSWRCPTLWIKVQRCPETRPRAGNSSSNWAV